MNRISSALSALILFGALGCASSNKQAHDATPIAGHISPASGTQVVDFKVGGQQRSAILVVPHERSKPLPLVFAFHGHGDTASHFENRTAVEKLWPAALVVYPNGVPGHRGITDADPTKTGWQVSPGESGDSDLAFFDAMLETLEGSFTVDRNRIYAMGHSNGSAFVSLLLNQRGRAIAATANLSAHPPPELIASDPVRSMFLSMGQHDPLVLRWHHDSRVPLVEKKLGVDRAHAKVDGDLREEYAPNNIELATYIYDGGHYPPPPEALELAVKFFQRHSLADG
jgi:polyhydroxybutyrate depolymerase